MGTFRNYPLNNFQTYHKALLPIVTVLYMASLVLIDLRTAGFYLLITFIL